MSTSGPAFADTDKLEALVFAPDRAGAAATLFAPGSEAHLFHAALLAQVHAQLDANKDNERANVAAAQAAIDALANKTMPYPGASETDSVRRLRLRQDLLSFRVATPAERHRIAAEWASTLGLHHSYTRDDSVVAAAAAAAAAASAAAASSSSSSADSALPLPEFDKVLLQAFAGANERNSPNTSGSSYFLDALGPAAAAAVITAQHAAVAGARLGDALSVLAGAGLAHTPAFTALAVRALKERRPHSSNGNQSDYMFPLSTVPFSALTPAQARELLDKCPARLFDCGPLLERILAAAVAEADPALAQRYDEGYSAAAMLLDGSLPAALRVRLAKAVWAFADRAMSLNSTGTASGASVGPGGGNTPLAFTIRTHCLTALARIPASYAGSAVAGAGAGGVRDLAWFKVWATMPHQPDGTFAPRPSNSGSSYQQYVGGGVHWAGFAPPGSAAVNTLVGEYLDYYYQHHHQQQPAKDTPEAAAACWEGVFHPSVCTGAWAKARVLHQQQQQPLPAAVMDDTKNCIPGGFVAFFGKTELQWEVAHAPATCGAQLDVTPVIPLRVRNAPGGAVRVRVYALRCESFYSEQLRALTPGDVDADGLTAHIDMRVDASTGTSAGTSTGARTELAIALPALAGRRGVFLLEAEAAGVTARALLHRGELRVAIATATSAGHALAIVDEAGRAVPDAVVVAAGVQYRAQAPHGIVIVPFAANGAGGRVPVVITSVAAAKTPTSAVLADDPFAATLTSVSSLSHFQQAPERHALTCAFHVDREALLPGAVAPLLFRPRLTVNDAAVSVARLRDVVLTVTAVDGEGVAATQTVHAPTIDAEAGVCRHLFTVPPQLVALTATLTATTSTSTNSSSAVAVQQHSCSHTFRLAEVDSTPYAQHQFLLRRCPARPGVVLVCVQSKAGAPLPGVRVTVSAEWGGGVRHSQYEVERVTDAQGCVAVPTTATIAAANTSAPALLTSLTVRGPGAMGRRSWQCPELDPAAAIAANGAATRPTMVAALAGQPVFVPAPHLASLIPNNNNNNGGLAPIPASLAACATLVRCLGRSLTSTGARGDGGDSVHEDVAPERLRYCHATGQLVVRTEGVAAGAKWLLRYRGVGGALHSLLVRVCPADAAALMGGLFVATGVAGAGGAGSEMIEVRAGDRVPLHIAAVTGAAVVGAPAADAASGDIVVSVAGASAKAKLYAFASHYHAEWTPAAAFAGDRPSNGNPRVVPAATPAPYVYCDPRAVGGEQQYVEARRGAGASERRVGVMLPQPSLQLAKRFKRGTQMDKDQEMGAKGRDAVSAANMSPPAPPPPCAAPCAGPMMMRSACYDECEVADEGPSYGRAAKAKKMMSGRRERNVIGGGGGGGYGGSGNGNVTVSAPTMSAAWAQLSHLAVPAARAFAVPVPASALVASGAAVSIVKLRRARFGPHHTSLTVIVVDGESGAVAVATVALKLGANAASVAAVRDVTCAAALPASTAHALQRLAATVAPGASTSITAPSAVHALSTTTDVGALALALTAANNPSAAPSLHKLAWLFQWGQLSAGERMDKVSQHMGHEAAFFLYCRDRAFFDAKVKPHLQSRLQKSVIDQYVCGEWEALARLADESPRAVAGLNTLERVLVAHAVTATKKQGAGAGIDAVARALADTAPRPDAAQWADAFATVVRARALGADASGGKDKKGGDDDADDGADDSSDVDMSDGDDYGDDGDYEKAKEQEEVIDSRRFEKRSRAAPMMAMSAAAPMPGAMMMRRGGPSAPSADMAELSAGPPMMMMRAMAMPSPAPQPAASFAALAEEAAVAAAPPRPTFTAPETTGEYEEARYAGVPNDKAAGLVPASLFWAAYAQHLKQHGSGAGFVSGAILTLQCASAMDVIAAVAVTDLPFVAAKPPAAAAAAAAAGSDGEEQDGGVASFVTRGDGDVVTVTAPGAHALLLLYEAVCEASSASTGTSTSMSVAVNYYDPLDRVRDTSADDEDGAAADDGEVEDRYIFPDASTSTSTSTAATSTNTMAVHRVYVCRVVVTNLSSATQRAAALLQLPQGAVAVRIDGDAGGGAGGDVVYVPAGSATSVPVTVSPFSSAVVEYGFAFQRPGAFAHAPASVTRAAAATISAASSSAVKVLAALTKGIMGNH